MTYFTITSIQMPVSDSGENINTMQHMLSAAMSTFPATGLVLFSELCANVTKSAVPEIEGGRMEQIFCDMAKEHRVWLIPGSIYISDQGKLYNSCPVINPDGVIVTRYRKMFPFLPFETGVEAGSQFCVFDIPDVGRFGVSICYDKWFPETTRTLAMMGAEVILHPTLTDTIDRDVELAITRTNAAINQCYFFDINSVGECGLGRSLIVGPAGDVIHAAGAGKEIIPVEINLQRVRREREKGLLTLGQPLKSFRDKQIDFQKAQTSGVIDSYLTSLGPLQKNGR